jgi:hypothetical protein
MRGKVNMARCPNEGVHFHSAVLCTSKGKIFLLTRSLSPLYGTLKGML